MACRTSCRSRNAPENRVKHVHQAVASALGKATCNILPSPPSAAGSTRWGTSATQSDATRRDPQSMVWSRPDDRIGYHHGAAFIDRLDVVWKHVLRAERFRSSEIFGGRRSP